MDVVRELVVVLNVITMLHLLNESCFKMGLANKINISTMSLIVDSLRTSSFSCMVNAKLKKACLRHL